MPALSWVLVVWIVLISATATVPTLYGIIALAINILLLVALRWCAKREGRADI